MGSIECPNCKTKIPGLQWQSHSLAGTQQLRQLLAEKQDRWFNLVNRMSHLECAEHVNAIAQYLDEVIELLCLSGVETQVPVVEMASSTALHPNLIDEQNPQSAMPQLMAWLQQNLHKSQPSSQIAAQQSVQQLNQTQVQKTMNNLQQALLADPRLQVQKASQHVPQANTVDSLNQTAMPNITQQLLMPQLPYFLSQEFNHLPSNAQQEIVAMIQQMAPQVSMEQKVGSFRGEPSCYPDNIPPDMASRDLGPRVLERELGFPEGSTSFNWSKASGARQARGAQFGPVANRQRKGTKRQAWRSQQHKEQTTVEASGNASRCDPEEAPPSKWWMMDDELQENVEEPEVVKLVKKHLIPKEDVGITPARKLRKINGQVLTMGRAYLYARQHLRTRDDGRNEFFLNATEEQFQELPKSSRKRMLYFRRLYSSARIFLKRKRNKSFPAFMEYVKICKEREFSENGKGQSGTSESGWRRTGGTSQADGTKPSHSSTAVREENETGSLPGASNATENEAQTSPDRKFAIPTVFSTFLKKFMEKQSEDRTNSETSCSDPNIGATPNQLNIKEERQDMPGKGGHQQRS